MVADDLGVHVPCLYAELAGNLVAEPQRVDHGAGRQDGLVGWLGARIPARSGSGSGGSVTTGSVARAIVPLSSAPSPGASSGFDCRQEAHFFHDMEGDFHY